MKIGYFCTSGHTEIGGIKIFLEKINPSVQWIRCFPIAIKYKLKEGRTKNTPIMDTNGSSHADLIGHMKQLFRDYCIFEDYDGFLLIDDLDCRFQSTITEGIQLFEQEISKFIQRICSENKIIRKFNFYTLFASPEIEAWFISDWNESFLREYPEVICYKVHAKLKKELTDKYWDDNIEKFGGKWINDSCKRKLSEIIQKIFEQVGIDENGVIYRFNKGENGRSMLVRINPEKVALKCRICFLPAYNRLRVL